MNQQKINDLCSGIDKHFKQLNEMFMKLKVEINHAEEERKTLRSQLKEELNRQKYPTDHGTG